MEHLAIFSVREVTGTRVGLSRLAARVAALGGNASGPGKRPTPVT